MNRMQCTYNERRKSIEIQFVLKEPIRGMDKRGGKKKESLVKKVERREKLLFTFV